MVAPRLEENHTLSELLPTRLDLGTYNKVLAEAKRQKISKTAFARVAIREYIASLQTTKPSSA